MRVLGLCITFLSIPSAVFLYRTLRFGRFMHFVPYVLILVGTAIAVAADPGRYDPFLLAFLALLGTAVPHADLYLDMQKQSK
jgi:hypothetical protein